MPRITLNCRSHPRKTSAQLLEKLWNSGFLQVTFSASRNDSAKDTVLCVERAEDTGMICGVRACGTWLQTPNLLQDLATAGVDSIVAPVASSSPEKHDALFGIGDFEKVRQSFAECKKWEVCPVAEVPLFQGSWKELKEILAMLGNQGVRNVLYYAIAEKPAELALRGPEIIQAAVEVEEYAAFSSVRYVWGVPLVREGNLQQIVEKGPRTPQDLSILVEADGSVYLSRGAKKPAGNILRSSWKEIWNGELCQEYKKRILSPTHCDICPGLAICAADCPGEPSGWAREEV